MIARIFLLCSSIAAQIAYSDVLIDDFETNITQNNLGYDWFYFSDGNDSGNSKVLNTHEISPGVFEKFHPDTPGYVSQRCGKLHFDLGDSTPVDQKGNLGYHYYNFAGIGTDLAPAGKNTELTPEAGVRFYARSSAPLKVVGELITSGVKDNGYHRYYFSLTGEWQQFEAAFRYFEQPDDNGWPAKKTLDPSTIQKITWKVFADVDGNLIGDKEYRTQDTGLIEIDNVYITGTDWIAPQRTAIRVAGIPQCADQKVAYPLSFVDLLGRQGGIEQLHGFSHGMYFRRQASGEGKTTPILPFAKRK